MTRLLSGFAIALLWSAAVSAKEPDACAVSEDLLPTDVPLTHVAAEIGQTKHLQIAVVGSASSTLRGTEGVQHDYPAQLEVRYSPAGGIVREPRPAGQRPEGLDEGVGPAVRRPPRRRVRRQQGRP